MKRLARRRCLQRGATLIEVLVSVLLLSFGMLSLGAMLSFAVQMPKLSGYRAAAVNLASSHIDRIRANPDGFQFYSQPLRGPVAPSGGVQPSTTPSSCAYPDCTTASLAAMDDAATRLSVGTQLPAGDMLVNCDTSTCGKGSHGNIWIVWQEPSTNAAFNASSSDNCPDQLAAAYPATTTTTRPRCLYLGFTV